MQKNNISKFTNCANCGACYNLCPKDAISIDKSDYFYKLNVDDNKCINCGTCVKVCPLNSFVPHLNIKGAYGGYHNNYDIIKNSSSGGAFSAIADFVLKKNGVVYEAAFTDNRKEVVVRSTKEVDFDELRRSKYVESSVMYSFKSILEDLECEKNVLFCGTPCQVAGLRRFLNKQYENLVTVDFACGGLASHKLYQEYMSSLSKKYHSDIKEVNFRAKLYGWSNYSFKVEFKNGLKYQIPSYFDPYNWAFMFTRVGIRDNCINCMFRENHYSDFIIADFWKWKSISKLGNDEKGISLVITNSDKAETIMNSLKKNMYLEKQDLVEAAYNCRPYNLKCDKEYLGKRKKFFEIYEKQGLKKASIALGMQHGIVGKLRKYKFILLNRKKKI